MQTSIGVSTEGYFGDEAEISMNTFPNFMHSNERIND